MVLVPVSVAFQKVQYRTISFLKGILNNMNHCEVIVYFRLSSIVNMTVHDNMYHFIVTNIILFNFVL